MRTVASVLLVAFLFVVGCEEPDTPEKIKADIMANMKEMASIMNGVTDEASAKAAVPKIQEVRAKMRDVAARAKKVKVGPEEMNKPPTKEEMETIGKLLEARQKLDDKPKLLEILSPALEGMENDM